MKDYKLTEEEHYFMVAFHYLPIEKKKKLLPKIHELLTHKISTKQIREEMEEMNHYLDSSRLFTMEEKQCFIELREFMQNLLVERRRETIEKIINE